MNETFKALSTEIQRFPGSVGIVLRDWNGEEFRYQAQQIFPAASTIKLPLLLGVLSLPDVDLQESILVTEANRATGSGVLKSLSPSLALSLQDLLTLMIIVSDNTATNVILDRFGLEFFNRYFAEQGWRDTHIGRKLCVPAREAHKEADDNLISAQDLADMLTRLWRDSLLTAERRRLALDILRQQHYLNFLRYLPVDADQLENSPQALRIYSKSGSLRRARHDAGILALENRVAILVVLTEAWQDLSFNPDNEGNKFLGRIGELVYRGLTRG